MENKDDDKNKIFVSLDFGKFEDGDRMHMESIDFRKVSEVFERMRLNRIKRKEQVIVIGNPEPPGWAEIMCAADKHRLSGMLPMLPGNPGVIEVWKSPFMQPIKELRQFRFPRRKSSRRMQKKYRKNKNNFRMTDIHQAMIMDKPTWGKPEWLGMDFGVGGGYSISKWHQDADGNLVIDDADLKEVSIIHGGNACSPYVKIYPNS